MRTISRIPIIFFILLLCNCTNSGSNKIYQKRVDEAKWEFYKWNFNKGTVVCNDGYKETNSSLCFFSQLYIDTLSIGDTLEVKVCVIHGGNDAHSECLCKKPYYYKFGFFPNADTVTYKVEDGMTYNRRTDFLISIPDSAYAKWAWMGVHSPKEQDKLFREFLKQNTDRLNPWLRAEAIKRGYLLN